MPDELAVTNADRDAARKWLLPLYDGPRPEKQEKLAKVIAESMAPERARAARMEKALRKLVSLFGRQQRHVLFMVDGSLVNYGEAVDEARAALGEDSRA